MRTPYDPPPLNPPADEAEWADYERRNEAAANQYAVMPSAFRIVAAKEWGE